MQSKGERGFSLIELLIVITIMAIIFGASVPFYRRYVAQTELTNVAQDLYLKLVTAHNNAVNGVVPKDAPTTSQRYYWVVNMHDAGTSWEYDTGACALVTDPAAPGYAEQFGFNFCNPYDYEHFVFPARFIVSHDYSLSYSEANVYFEPITGMVRIYSIDGLDRLDDPTDLTKNAINIRVASKDYPQLAVTFHVNHQGTITQESEN
ncbi:MAG: type II secretion system GspH family protein [bacterium]|nr:type II secretion system GspH family protein [bacterium]